MIVDTHYMPIDYVDENGIVYSAKQIKNYLYKHIKTIQNERIEKRPNGTTKKIRYTTKQVQIINKQGDLFEQ